MAAGCIPDRDDRLAALAFARNKLRKAVKILDDITHPDRAPRQIEEACAMVTDSLGQRADAFIDRTKKEGLEDLLEHYFS